MEIIIALLVLLSISLIFGEFFRRFGLPSVAGQLLAGIVLGPVALNIVTPTSSLTSFSDIALFFIIFMIGAEVTTEVLTEHLRQAFAFTATSFIIPSALMALVAVLLFGLPVTQGVIIAVAIGVPSISIISVLLYRHKLLKLELGHVILASVVFTDIIAFGALAAISGGAFDTTLVLSVTLLVFIAVLLLIDRSLRAHSKRLKRFFDSVVEKEYGEDLAFGGVLILGLVVASFLQLIGITFVLGAFFAGTLLSEYVMGKRFYGRLIRTLRRINNSFFIPLFFSIAALSVILPSIQILLLLVTMLLISVIAGGALNAFAARKMLPKISGRYIIGFFGGRGAVGVIIGSIALLEGLISNDLYSAIVLATLAMAIAMPLLLVERGKSKLSIPAERRTHKRRSAS
ncbi:MAG: cation:proton antiporter [Candidatus Micrarchaeales archaeon]|nr:cation:proton antiporter [Candidatus Micrarchaeales archaeon]